MSFLST